MKIIADNTVPYLKGILEPIADIQYIPSHAFTPTCIKDADALIVRSIDTCTRELLEGSKVQLITSATIGFDHIDIQYCNEKGIAWRNAPGCNAMSVAQYVLASLITISRKKGEPLAGKTIGIVGVGHVGKEVEKLCTAYGLHVLRNDPPRAEKEGEEMFVSLETIASEADIITFHTPLIKKGRFATYHLAGEAFFSRLKRKPWFVNASRGAVQDTSALLKAIRMGLVSETVIDCWENEPNINGELLTRATLATPHIAGFSADGKANGTRRCLENIESFFQIKIEKLGEVVPPDPVCSAIDLNGFTGNRVEQAILACFDPLQVDRLFRDEPEKFEWFRAHYAHPREFGAYTVLNATAEEALLLHNLGFRLPATIQL